MASAYGNRPGPNGFSRGTPPGPEAIAQPGPGSDRDDRLETILGNYYGTVSDDESSRLAWIARYPDFAADLAAYFLEQDRLYQLTRPLRAAAPHVTEPESGLLGDYELLEVLARGGMGVVYKARQVSLNRVVALKVIIAGEFAGPADVQRFRAEAEAVARLDHPHIVPIYEVGCEHGRHFFSMKLFEGGSLATHLARYAADPRAAAALLVTVARAVHHAHQRGVLHRDLKPSNVLLDTEGRPHVVDFGLAKHVSAGNELTQSGMLLGSPSYMAPEQATAQKGGVTTATDVYGLGALLYTMLTGRPPFQADSAWATIEQVKGRSPELPSGINRLVDRDLQTICLKCLEKDPARRYASAADLADDLDRWLRGEPIAARPVQRTERAWRWCRRNPVVASLAATLGVLFLATMSILAASNVFLAAKQREVVRQRDRSRRVVDEMYTQYARDVLANQPRMTAVQRAFLEKALGSYEEFAREAGEERETILGVAWATVRVAQIRDQLGATATALGAARLAVARCEALINAYPHWLESERALCEALESLGRIQIDAGRFDEARASWDRAIAVARRFGAGTPRAPEADRLLLARIHSARSTLENLAGQFEEAERQARLGLAQIERWETREDGSDELLATLADLLKALNFAMTSYARPVADPARNREALRYQTRAVALFERLTRAHRESAGLRRSLGAALLGQGLCYKKVSEYANSEAPLRRAVAVLGSLVDDFPDVPDYRHRWDVARLTLALTLGTLNHLDQEQMLLRECIASLDWQTRTMPDAMLPWKDLLLCQECLGASLARAGKIPEATTTLLTARELGNAVVNRFPDCQEIRIYFRHVNADLKRIQAGLPVRQESEHQAELMQDTR